MPLDSLWQHDTAGKKVCPDQLKMHRHFKSLSALHHGTRDSINSIQNLLEII